MSKKKDNHFGGGAFGALEGLKKKLEEDEKKKEQAKEEAKRAGQKPPPRAPDKRPLPQPKRTADTDREDELSFHRMMSGVVPLDQEKKGRVPVTSATQPRVRVSREDLRAKAEAEAAEVLDHLHRLVDDDGVRFEVTDDGKRVEGRRVDVPPALLRSIRHGALPIDARLDLHAMRADDAREAVLSFLKEKRQRGERCVLVIHGKGEGVLRGEIAAWLSQGRAREHVAAFATARDEDGGEGAVYVALRR
jgi:DNA-nicking Smr family endonuclease